MRARIFVHHRGCVYSSLLLASVGLVLIGCQGYYAKHIYGNESSPYFTVPVDSAFELKKPVIVPARRSRLFFQDGRAIALGQVNRYGAYCSLDVALRRPAEQVVEPDTFVVRSVDSEFRYTLAGYGRFLRVGQRDDSGGTDYMVVATILELNSPKQPHVERLVCAKWGLPQDRSNVTIAMIRDALDGFFVIRWQ